MASNNWTREETIIAFNVYCKIPFKKSNQYHPLIRKYAEIIGRTPSALNMKIGNLGRLDPSLSTQGISRLTHGAKLEEEVWNEFYDNPDKLAYESERLIADILGKSVEETVGIKIDSLPKGEERIVQIRQRVNQSFFRNAVLTSYNNSCCISGITDNRLLEACHIVDWSEDEHNRTNPCNGICLNPLFHKAYDKHLLGISPDYVIRISENLLESVNAEGKDFKTYLLSVNGKKIELPDRFLPNKDLLDVHYQKFLKVI